MNTYTELTSNHRSSVIKHTLILPLTSTAIYVVIALILLAVSMIFYLERVAFTIVFIFPALILRIILNALSAWVLFARLASQRKKSHSYLAEIGLYSDAMIALERTKLFRVDDKVFGLNSKYLYLQHGAIFPVSAIRSIRSKKGKYILELSDGESYIAAWGQTSSEISRLWDLLHKLNPVLLIHAA